MKISIVIPTRERSQYLRYSVQTALQIEDENIEIVVSDNASMDGTKKMLDEFSDPRLVYVNTGSRVSMRENFNHAFMASTGEYLVYFGDDDGILPKQFKFLRAILEQYKPDGASWERLTYGWPIEGYGKKTGGVRIVKSNIFGIPRAYQGAQNRDNLLACRLDKLCPMPEIYHGCISRDYLLKIAMDPTIIFDSAIPDYNIAYRAILKSGNFYHVNHVFSINGYSPASTGGGQNAAQRKTGDDSSSKLFEIENKTDTVSDVIAYAGSVPLAFFSTLETIRHRHELMEFKPNYLSWYRYVLSSSRANADLEKLLKNILLPHAEETGSMSELKEAQKLPLQPKQSWVERVKKWRRILTSFRVSTKKDGKNTVLTAAETVDTILGEDFGKVQSNEITASAAWKSAARRSKSFVRQL